MNKSVLMIMGGAVIIAIIVAMLVQMKMSPRASKEPSADVEILVANKMLMTGDALKQSDVSWQAWPSNSVFRGMIKKADQPDENKLEVYGKPLRRDIMSGEPVTTQSVIVDAKESGSFLSSALAPGMRAVGLPVKAETTAGGFVITGDYVDVILTYQINMRGDAENYSADTVQRFASETVLSNIRVLAVDQNAKEGDREAKVARTVTLEVTKEGAQILAMASTMGTISLALRRVGEKDTQADQDVPLTTDVTTSHVIKKIYELMHKSKTTSNTVRLYSGSTVVNVPVRAVKAP